MTATLTRRKACSCSHHEEAADTICVEVPQVEVDSQEDHSAQCGYGACSISGCYCQSYMGSGYTCSNCGHNYGSHW